MKRYHDIISIRDRHKRSIIPVVGKALGYLFGIASESDMKAVNKAILSLKITQKGVTHLLEDNISIINITREEVSQNRHTINVLIRKLGGSLNALQKSIVPAMKQWNIIEKSTR